MNNKHRTDPLWGALQNIAEGRILILGLSLALIGVAGLAGMWVYSPDKAQIALGISATNIIFGRAAGLSFGYASKLPHSIVLPINMYIETLLVLLFYPLFVFVLQHLINWPALQRLVNRIQATAMKREKAMERFGMLGIFLFVFFPFWLTGPVMGCAVGYLIGLKPWKNIAAVLSGTYIAILSWGIFLERIYSKLAIWNPVAPFVLLGIVILLVAIGQIARRHHHKK